MYLIFCQIVSIAKFKSQKLWSRSVDICDDGEGKTWRGVDSTPPPPPPAEIGLGYNTVVRLYWVYWKTKRRVSRYKSCFNFHAPRWFIFDTLFWPIFVNFQIETDCLGVNNPMDRDPKWLFFMSWSNLMILLSNSSHILKMDAVVTFLLLVKLVYLFYSPSSFDNADDVPPSTITMNRYRLPIFKCCKNKVAPRWMKGAGKDINW